MTPELFQRIRDAVETLRGLPEDRRAPFLESLPPDLRREVADLLSCETLAAAVESPLAPTFTDPDALPSAVGRYQVLSLLGEGGMGRVYLAKQEHPHREVALKVVRAGALSRSVLRRFELESELLGQLQHPGIAQILEAGVAEVRYPDGRALLQPFYAMELVRGVPLTAFIAARNLPLRDRLALLADVADAVEHAHRRGIIHRDLKPANILVGEDGVPKILDFGVARALTPDFAATTQTHAGQIIGTLAYMSPEQTLGDSRAVDTRSDVYSLGVLLYEALTGRVPLDVRELPLPEAARSIREDEPTRAGSIIAQLRGDPETITAKAIEKDRLRRYQSAGELAADLRRFLADEPIIARPASTLYQLRKFAKRNKPLVGGVLATVLVLAIGIATTSIAAARASRQRAAADRSAYRANIAAAQAGIEAGDGPLVGRSLGAALPALRGWEWNYFSFLASRSLVTIPGPPGRRALLASSADGDNLATLASDGALRLFTASGAPAWPAPVPLGQDPALITRIAFASPSLLIACDAAAGLRAFDTATGRERWRALEPFYWDCLASHDASTLAVVGRERSELLLLSPADGAVTRRIPLPSVAHFLLGFSADDREVTVQTFVNAFSWRFWTVTLATGAVREERCGSANWHWRLADGRFVGAVVDEADLRVVDHATGKNLGRAPVFIPRKSGAVVMSSDGARLASIESGSTLRLVDMAFGAASCIEHLPSPAVALEFLTPARLATVHEDGSTRVWDAQMAPAPLDFRASAALNTSVAKLSDDASRVLFADWGAASLWETSTGRPLGSVQFGAALPAAVVPPDQHRFALLTQQSTVVLIDTARDAVSFSASPNLGPYAAILWAAWSSDHATLRVAVRSGELFTLNGATAEILSRATHTLSASLIAQTPRHLLFASADALHLHRRDDLAELWRLPYPDLAAARPAAAFSDNRIAVALRGHVRLLRLSDGATLHDWPWADLDAVCVTWTPDASRLVVLSSSATLRFIDPVTGDETASIHAPEIREGDLAFTPDASALIAAGVGRVRVLETRHDPALAPRRELVRRAAALIDPLFERLRLPADILEALNKSPGAEPPLPESLLDEARSQTLARGLDVNRLNERAWAVVIDPTSSAADNLEAARFARACVAAMPGRWGVLNTLALAELRAGNPAEALLINDQCIAIHRASATNPTNPTDIHPADLAIRGLIDCAQGRPAQAAEIAARLAASTDPRATSGEVVRLAEEIRRTLRATPKQ